MFSHIWLFATPWTAAHQASLSFTVSWSLLRFMSIESVIPSNHLILCHPLLLLPSIFPSIRVFSTESVLHIRWPKYWSFSIGPSNEYSGLISFKIDWLDFLVVQETLKCLLQHHSLKASVLLCSAYFMVQYSHPYMTTGKTIVLSIWTFVGKVMSLPFNTLSRCVIAFLPRSKHLLISWLQSRLYVALSILWIFGSLSLPIPDLPGCATFLPRSAPIISVVMKKFFQMFMRIISVNSTSPAVVKWVAGRWSRCVICFSESLGCWLSLSSDRLL